MRLMEALDVWTQLALSVEPSEWRDVRLDDPNRRSRLRTRYRILRARQELAAALLEIGLRLSACASTEADATEAALDTLLREAERV